MMDEIRRLGNRVKGMFVRAKILSVDDTQPAQVIKCSGLSDEVLERIQNLQQYGITANAPAGGEILIAFMGGDRSDPIVLSVDSFATRPRNLEPGEAALYNGPKSTWIKMKDDGTAEVNCTLVSLYDIQDSVGTLNQVREDLASLRTEFDLHVHGGVTSGPAVTTPPQAPPTP